jgi:hypothetical protein
MPEPKESLVRRRERNVLRWVALGIMLFLTAVAVIAVLQGRGDGPPAENMDAVSPLPLSPLPLSPEPTPIPSPTDIGLPDIKGIPNTGTAVLIVTERDSCWRGYVGGTKIEGCGLEKVTLTRVPNTIKAGVQLRKTKSYFLEIYIVHEGEAMAADQASVAGELLEVRANLSG